MSVSLAYTCDAEVDEHSICGRTLRVRILEDAEGPVHAVAQLRAAGWVGGVFGTEHRCDWHSGVPPIPARVPQTRHDVPSGAADVPPASNVTPFRPRRRT